MRRGVARLYVLLPIQKWMCFREAHVTFGALYFTIFQRGVSGRADVMAPGLPLRRDTFLEGCVSWFVVGHEAKCHHKRSQKEDGHLRALLRTGKAPLFVVGHEAKRSARRSVHKKRTGTCVPYYEREKPFVCSRARSEAECPSKRSQKKNGHLRALLRTRKALRL